MPHKSNKMKAGNKRIMVMNNPQNRTRMQEMQEMDITSFLSFIEHDISENRNPREGIGTYKWQ